MKQTVSLMAVACIGINPLLADDQAQTLVIKAKREDSSEMFLERIANPVEPDIGQSLSRLPGASFNANGAVTVLPQYRGHIGTRTSVRVNGFPIVSAGPNLMDAPLSYASTPWLDQVTLYRGIAPVSVDIDTLASHIDIKLRKPDYTLDKAGQWQGGFRLGYASAGQALEQSLDLGWANQHQRVQLLASDQSADEFDTPLGELNNTQFDKQAQQFSYGFRAGSHALDVFFAKQDVDNSGTPALPSDILFIDAERSGAEYRFDGESVAVELGFFDMDALHDMSNFTLRPVASPMRARLISTDSTGQGAHLKLQWDAWGIDWQAGVETRSAEHNMVITNPNNAAFRVSNFNQASQDTETAYVETSWGEVTGSGSWMIGARHKTVDSDAQDASHFMAMMNPVVGSLLTDFNQADKRRELSNTDWMISYQLAASESTRWYFGIGEKYRAPVYQELFLWIPLQATAGLADGNVYIGDTNLEMEQATQFEIGFTFENDAWSITPQVYFHQLDNYIQGVPATNMNAIMFANAMGATGEVLQFANVEGEIYGLDTSIVYRIDEHWQIDTVVSFVRASRTDIDEPLYRIMPDNFISRLEYLGEQYSYGLEWQVVDNQDRVAELLNESETPGYGLLNVFADLQLAPQLNVVFGVNNLTDKLYVPHLAGRNRVAGNSVPLGAGLPGVGRHGYITLDYRF